MYRHIAVIYSTTNTASRPVSYTLSDGDATVYAEITGNKVNICKNDVNAILTGINFKNDQSITSVDYLPSSIINMSNCFDNCINLTGKILSGPNVTTMDRAYRYCYNLTGSPVCGPNVIDLSYTYYGCNKITGSPVCGDKVTNMGYTYLKCSNLTGSPVCGNNVIDMKCAYKNCFNLTGSPVCGPNVNTMYQTYARCYNLSGSLVMYSDNITNMSGCFANRYNTKELKIFVHPNTTSLTSVLKSDTSSIMGVAMTWTDDMATNGCYYNSMYNVKVYPVDEFVLESYNITNHSGASYGFYYDTTNDFWISGNKGVHSSAALCNVRIENPTGKNVIFEYICNGESSYDYALFSNVNKTLVANYSSDSINVFHNCYGQSSTALKTLNYGPVSGTIQVKYRKDSSADKGYDTIQFRVKFE